MSAGKGDAPRPVNGPQYRANFDRIFPEKKSCQFTKLHEVRPITTTDDNTPSTPAHEVTDDGHEL